ncbi:MAG: IS30 family transposase [Paracoccaceae bacterium]|nr:IS30 family transposase [Paracoccaceae bacterium]
MARVLKRHESTIFREIKRNYWTDDAFPKTCAGYFGMAAHQRSQRRRSTQRKLIRYPELFQYIVERLKNGWTPEQIGNRMIFEGAKLRVCQETIYRCIYSKEGMAQELWCCLPLHRKNRTSRRARKRLPSKIDRDASILFRPEDVAHRRQFGHSEGDLKLFEQKFGQTNVTSFIERVSRYTAILKNPNKPTKPVMGKIMKAIRDLPLIARRSIIFDRGPEFVSWLHLQAEIGTQTWFCDPPSTWQKGPVENTNRRARSWLPKKRDITALTDRDIKAIFDRLNNTHHKCLGWKTPAEVFREKMMEEMGH